MTATQQITTPQARQVLRRSVFWLAIVVVVLIAIAVTLTTSRALAPRDPLGPSNPAPDGAQAIARVLEQQGVRVTETGSLDSTKNAIADAAATTLVYYDDGALLDRDQLAELSGLADHLVLIDPDYAALDELAPGVRSAGFVEGTLTAECDLVPAQKAGTITGEGRGYRSEAGSRCFSSGDDVYSLVQVQTEAGGRVSVIGATTALSNEYVAQNGNAALALNLLGEEANLVWYLPTVADLPDGPPVTLADLTPQWVTPLALLALLVGLAAALWKGRRFGALVVENLPVTVRSSETMEGRARLYSTASSRLHALDSLRVGTVTRVAATLGLPRVATVEEVVAAASEVLGMDPRHIRLLLLDAVPSTDHELIQLSDDLLRLEGDLSRALRPSKSGPERMGE